MRKVGALLPSASSPARRGKFTGKISGRLQAGRREQPTRARPRPTHASSLPPTIKRHQHRLVRGFCAVATKYRLRGSPAGRDTRSNAGLHSVERRDMVKVVEW